LINGSPLLREWVDDPDPVPDNLEKLVAPDEYMWTTTRVQLLLYR
jgi:hypothetical protein